MRLLDYHTAISRMRTVKLLNVTAETPTVKSFEFIDELCSRGEPGQFVMVWVPGVDEVPMSLSMLNPEGKRAAVAVKRVGEATEALYSMKTGDIIGVRGPFGSSYTISRAGKVMCSSRSRKVPLIDDAALVPNSPVQTRRTTSCMKASKPAGVDKS